VPPGSIAIGGEQTGIYSVKSPGGWRIIGRTPLNLFQLEMSPPTLLQMGNHVQFRPIHIDEFLSHTTNGV
jgi:inhibitor of KinA